jgi:hypothetical protein
MGTHLTRQRFASRSALAVTAAVLLLVVPVTAAFARPTPAQFATLMQRALIAKASTYHLTKAQINAAFKQPTLRSNLYTAGSIICQKLATETPKKAAADLVTFTKSLQTAGNPGGNPLPTPSATPKPSLSLIKGVVGVGLTVSTAKGSLCPNQQKKAASTLVIYNKAVGAKK